MRLSKKRIGAGADQERALQRRDGAVDGAGGGERAEIAAGPRLRAAMLEDLRRPVVAGDQDVGKRLVVAQLHVEARPQLLDQIGFEQQRLGLGRGRDDLDRDGRRDHAQDARRLRRVDPRIGGQPLADVLGLADIEHVAGRIEHAVDAGRGGRKAHRVLDRGMADRQRALGDRLGRLLRRFRAAAPRRRPRRLTVAGSMSAAGQVLWRHVRLGTALARFRGRDAFGWSVESSIHGPKLSAASAASPALGERAAQQLPVTHP